MAAGMTRSQSQSSIDAASSTKHITIVTTAAPPWLTGTAVNPALRAAYLARKGHKVTLMVPFLTPDEQPLLFPSNRTFDSPAAQKAFVFQYLEERTGFHLDGLDILFYPGRYDKLFCSIIPTGDIIQLVPGKPDLVILEEPEHLTWYHHGKRWAACFPLVVGIAHTAYVEYVAREAGEAAALALGRLNRFLVGAHCHKVIKLSDAVQSLPREETLFVHGVSNGFLEVGKHVRAAMAAQRPIQPAVYSTTPSTDAFTPSTMGSGVGSSAVPSDKLAHLLTIKEEGPAATVPSSTGMDDCQGRDAAALGRQAALSNATDANDGAVEQALQRRVADIALGSPSAVDGRTDTGGALSLSKLQDAALHGTQPPSTGPCQQEGTSQIPGPPQSSGTFSDGCYFLGKAVWAKGYRELLDMLSEEKQAAAAEGRTAAHCDIFGKGDHLEEIKAEAARLELDVTFHGARDHLSSDIQAFQVFLNPSTSDVVATTSAEALAMNKWLVCAEHPCNQFFSSFANALIYRDPAEFVEKLRHALTHPPHPMTEKEQKLLSWEDACDRLLSVAFTPAMESPRPVRKAVEKVAYEAYSRLLGIEYIRRAVGAGKNTKVAPLFGEDEELERMASLELYPVGCF